MSSALFDRWLAEVVATPGLTAIRSAGEARRVLLDDSLRGLELVAREGGTVVDVGSGGGVPGIPLALSLPKREFALLEAQERKCMFLRAHAPVNARVVHGRAEEQELDWAGCAVAKALAPPPVAAEWCLPLVRSGGAVVLWVGPSADAEQVARVAEKLNARLEESPPGFFVLRKLGPTPSGFPRRAGRAKKRPLL
ncbi:MAG: RsmG family class I SAM-dependent methyltransferase [Gaiellaceae bacterium]